MKATYKCFSAAMAVFLILISMQSQAAFLRDVPQTLNQPDGTVLHCFATGDEYHNWLHDADNYTILRNPETGFYVYANRIDGKFVATDLIPGIDSPEANGIEKGLQPDPEEIYEKSKEFRENLRDNKGGAPNTGNVNNIVIFIRFADQSEFSEPISVLNSTPN